MNLRRKPHYGTYLLLGYAFLLFVHFIVKDNIHPLSIVFYATPLPILIILGLILVLFFIRKKGYRIILLISLSLLTFHWLTNYYHSNTIANEESYSKAFYWNLAKREQLPIKPILEQVNTHNPEVIAFVETPQSSLINLEALTSKLPEYNFKTLKGSMLVGAKGDIELLDFKYGKNSYKVNLIKASTPAGQFKFIITDVTADIFVRKKTPLEFILNFSTRHDVDFIVGDFNTPYESVYFKDYADGFNSFHHFNDGFSATWPLGMPLLEIDHVWLSKRHQPIALYKAYNSYSDHALLISRFKTSKN